MDVVNTLYPVLIFAAGVLLGAWVYGRGRMGKGVLPLPSWPEKVPEQDKPMSYPKVRP